MGTKSLFQVDEEEIAIAVVVSGLCFAIMCWGTKDFVFSSISAMLGCGGWFAFMAGLYATRDYLKEKLRLY